MHYPINERKDTMYSVDCNLGEQAAAVLEQMASMYAPADPAARTEYFRSMADAFGLRADYF